MLQPRNNTAVFVLASLVLAASVAQAQEKALEGLDTYIRKAMAEWQVPGLAIAVVKDDAVVFRKGYGVRQVGGNAEVDTKTVFALSSNGKAFTAAAVAMLVDEGKLSWDDPIVKHLPWFQLPDPWVTRQVTLRDMLSHRISGDLGAASGQLWAFTSFGAVELLRRLRYLEPASYRFRSVFEYNNPNILSAGQVVAAVSGMSWAEFMKTRILGPLGMTSATTSVYELWDEKDVAPCYECEIAGHTVDLEDAHIDNIVMPHIPTQSGLRPIPWRTVDNIAPAGSINANVDDVANWVRFQLGKGTFEGKQLLSAATFEEMHTPQMITPASPILSGSGFGHFQAYGMGWHLRDYRGRKVVVHGGGITGFRSTIALMPEANVGLAILTNQNLEPGPVANHLSLALAFRIFDAYLGAPARDWSAEVLSKVKASGEILVGYERQLAAARVKGSVAPASLETYVGTYTHPAFGRVSITEEDGAFVFRFAGALAGDVEHWHYDTYRISWRGPHQWFNFATFGWDEAGRVNELTIQDLATFALVADRP